MQGPISGVFSICLSTCQPIHVGLLWPFLQVEVSQWHLQVPGWQTQQVGQVFQEMHKRARKQPTVKSHRLVNPGMIVYFQTYCRCFTSCSYQCYCGLNRKLHTNGDGRNISTDKGGLLGEVREYPRCWLLCIFSEWPWIFSLLETMATSIRSCKIISCLAVSDYISSPNSEVKSLHKEEEQKLLKSKPELIVLNPYILKMWYNMVIYCQLNNKLKSSLWMIVWSCS